MNVAMRKDGKYTVSGVEPMTLSASYMTTILYALAKCGTPQSVATIRELERQGVRIPVWIHRDVLALAWKEGV